MSRKEEARTFLESWEPDEVELPDWIVDEIESDASLAALFDRRFLPWEAHGLGKKPQPQARRRIPVGLPLTAVGLALAAAALIWLAPQGEPLPAKTSFESVVDAPTVDVPVVDVPGVDASAGDAPVVVLSTPDIGKLVKQDPELKPAEASPLDMAQGDEVGGVLGGAITLRETPPEDPEPIVMLDSNAEQLRWQTGPVAGNSGGIGHNPAFFGRTYYAGSGTESPDYRSPVEEQGQHRVVVQKSQYRVTERIQFAPGTTQALSGADGVLDAVAQVMKEHPELGPVRVTGHAALSGDETRDLHLSQQRAEQVRQELIARGVDPSRLVAEGAGNSQPLASNHTAEGQARNARVEFVLAEQEPVPVPAPAPVPAPVVPAPNTEEYTDYGHHSFHLTEKDALSTFSIDVDTASYTLVRRKLNEGYLPPPAAVRVEEFVNALPYDYPRPPDDAPFGVSFEGAPNPFNPRTALVRVGIQGKRVAVDQRRSVHLTFLVDTSGSMQSDDKLGLVKYALKELVGELKDGDTVALVAYAGSAGVVLRPTPMSQRESVLRAIGQLEAGGSTAMGAGIELAYKLASETYHEGAVNRVIILSDGDANVGPTDPKALNNMIRGYAQRGITLTVAGFGEGNYKDSRMERLANDGDGNYYYIDSPKQARRVFVDQLTGTLVVIARDVKIQVAWDPRSVVAYRLLGYENRDIADRDFRNDAVDAGEIGAGHRVTALYEVALAPGASPGAQLATVAVRNKAPGPDAPAVERKYALTAEALRPDLSETTRAFRIALAAAYFAESLRGSPHLHGQGLGEVAALARNALRPEYPEDAELVALIERARQLRGE